MPGARHLVLALLLPAACGGNPERLPLEDRVAALEAVEEGATLPLHQLMYDSAFLHEVQHAEQRTRILIWLRYVDLEEHQLTILESLHGRAAELRVRVERALKEIVERFEPELVPPYDQVWDLLQQGAPLDDPRLAEVATTLMDRRLYRAREEEYLAIRFQSVRALLDEEQELLRSLSPEQEKRFPDLVFALRRDLDIAATPGDFRALVGTLVSPGDPTLLLRGSLDPERGPLDLGGLWSDGAEEDLSGPVLHEARRELLLYLLLQEPALPEAISAARAARRHRFPQE